MRILDFGMSCKCTELAVNGNVTVENNNWVQCLKKTVDLTPPQRIKIEEESCLN